MEYIRKITPAEMVRGNMSRKQENILHAGSTSRDESSIFDDILKQQAAAYKIEEYDDR